MCVVCESRMLDFGSGTLLGPEVKLRGGVLGDICVGLELAKIKTKNNATKYRLSYYGCAEATGKTESQDILINYCPFCGRELK